MRLINRTVAGLALAALLALPSQAQVAQTPSVAATTGAGPVDTGTLRTVPANFSNYAPYQVSVSTTATLLVAARSARGNVTVINPVAVVLCLGNVGVTLSTGECLPGVVGASRTLPFNGALYGVFASGTATVTGSELY